MSVSPSRDDSSLAGLITRRQFLAAGSLAALAAAITGCGGGGKSGSDGRNADLTVMSNGADPLFLIAKASNDRTIEYFGTRSDAGLPVTLDRITVKESGGAQSHFDLDSQGRPVRMAAPDGTTLILEWLAPKKAALTALLPNGSNQINTVVDFENPSRRAMPGPARPVSRMPNRTPRGGRPIRVDYSPYAGGSGEMLDTRQGGGSSVTVNVSRCGAPDRSYQTVTVHVRDSGGRFLGSFPAFRVGDGVYRAKIPSGTAPTVNPQELCRSLESVLGSGCTALELLGPTAAVILCDVLAAAIDAATIPTGEAAIFIAACHRVVPLMELYCQTAGASPAPGAPSVAERLCQGVFQNRAVPQEIQLSASIPALPSDITSGTVTAPGNGPYPNLAVNMGGSPAIDSFTLNPANPAAGVDYVGTARVLCVPSGATVELSIVGTDGYTDRKTYNVSETTANGTYTLTVPGAEAQVRDTVTLTVTLPGGQTLTRTASLVFG